MPEGTIYSADDIVGRSLYAKQQVPLKWLANDVARPFVWIPAGEMVGIVNSYLLPNDARTRLYWQFINDEGTPYYAEHIEGRFDISALEEQGVQTTQEKQQAAAEASMPLPDKILSAFQSLGKYGITALAVVLIVGIVIWIVSKRI